MADAPPPPADAAAAPRRARAWHHLLIAHAPDALYALDGDGRVRAANAAFCRLLGLRHDAALALRVWDWDIAQRRRSAAAATWALLDHQPADGGAAPARCSGATTMRQGNWWARCAT